jgi:hypothetical protein
VSCMRSFRSTLRVLVGNFERGSHFGSRGLYSSSSSFVALQSISGPWPPVCRGFKTTEFLRGEDVSSTTNPQPAVSGYLSLSSISFFIRPAWVTLLTASLSPAYLSSLLVQASSLAPLDMH